MMRREFTGRDMALILVAGFGVVIAVNLLLAVLATRGFGGVVVENSYVASQRFNGWLSQAREERALGWEADVVRREDGRLAVLTRSVPGDARVVASLRRPLGARQETDLLLVADGAHGHVSSEPIDEGRWLVRLAITAGAQRWSSERELE